MPPSRDARTRPGRSALVLLFGLFAACGSNDAADASATPDVANDATVPAPAPAGGLTATDVGIGSVAYNGTTYDNFTGNCELSRLNGREEMGDLANLEGVKLTVGIDNTKSSPPTEMNFVAYSNLDFTMANGSERLRGTLSQLAYESALTPKGTSQAMAKVAFTGQTSDGVPVVAHVVCEIQNKF